MQVGTGARPPLATTITTAKTQTTATTTAETVDLADATKNRTAILRSRRITDRGRAIATNNPDIKYVLAFKPSYSTCARANLRLYSNNEDIPNHPQAAIHEEAQAGSAKAAVQEAEAQEAHQEQPCKPTTDAKTATEAAIVTEATEATVTDPAGTARARANHPRIKTTTATTRCPTTRQ